MSSTKPIRSDASTRLGHDNRQLTHVSGEGVTRALNDIACSIFILAHARWAMQSNMRSNSAIST